LIFLFGPAGGASGTNADIAPGAPNTFAPGGGFCLYGPGACGGSINNGLSLGPNGGNFLALDGALTSANTPPVNIQGRISQTIGGLTPGVPVILTFNWAAAQQAGFTGPTTEQLAVSLGGQTESTPVVTNPQADFQKWMPEEFTFTPTSTSEVLSFLGIGTPATGVANAGPPFVLLESPDLTEVPLPASWSLLLLGFAGIATCAYWRRKSVGVAEAGAA